MTRTLRITLDDDVYTVWESDEGLVWDTATPGPLDEPSAWQHGARDAWLFQGLPVTVDVLEGESTTYLSGGWRLTTGHPSSSNGVPVLVDGYGAPYGPRDLVEFQGRVMPAFLLVDRLANWNGTAGAPLVTAFQQGAPWPPMPPPRDATGCD